ncbi:MAG: hypothetical protein KIS70_04035 [Xanthobacteraceae bacterium]|nr:hypothetical protein [Xanthobacteraceae bacterium]
MTIERRNTQTGKYQLYNTSQQHGEDCALFPYESLPRKIFLDTNVIGTLVEHGATIFEHEGFPENVDATLADDIEALMHISAVSTRANWMLFACKKTLEELANTKDAILRDALLDYGSCFVDYHDGDDWRYAADFARRLKDSKFVSAISGRADRELISNAVGLGCDVFCTRDRSTIISKRDALRQIPMRILTPAEWWRHIRPWAGLWL